MLCTNESFFNKHTNEFIKLTFIDCWWIHNWGGGDHSQLGSLWWLWKRSYSLSLCGNLRESRKAFVFDTNKTKHWPLYHNLLLTTRCGWSCWSCARSHGSSHCRRSCRICCRCSGSNLGCRWRCSCTARSLWCLRLRLRGYNRQYSGLGHCGRRPCCSHGNEVSVRTAGVWSTTVYSLTSGDRDAVQQLFAVFFWFGKYLVFHFPVLILHLSVFWQC